MWHLARSGRLADEGTITRWLGHFLGVEASEIRGCTEAELVQIERLSPKPLPLAYKQFLREAGIAVGHAEVASHFSRACLLYPQVLAVKPIAVELAGTEHSELFSRIFPFYNWEVYRLCALDLKEDNEDPPVLIIDEQTGSERRLFNTFSQFIGWEILMLADAITLKQEHERKAKDARG
jgi:hypothetical protein